MYKYFLSALFLSNTLYACDFCGCSPSSMNTDILSAQPQSSVGTSVQYRNFKHVVTDINVKRTQIVTQNFFVSYAPKKWVDIRVSLPVMWVFNNYIKIDENTPKLKEKKSGISDLTLFSNFRVWQRSPLGKKTGHVINLGYGMSFPTGSKKSSVNDLLQDFNFGTQAVGFLFSANYSLSIKNWGLMNSALVKINMKNKDNVRYGNQYSYKISGNYTTYIKKVAFIPVVGMGINIEQKNIHNDILQEKSGAWILQTDLGLQCVIKGITVAASISQPMAQKTSGGDILQKTGFNFLVKYQITKKSRKPEMPADMQMPESTPTTPLKTN